MYQVKGNLKEILNKMSVERLAEDYRTNGIYFVAEDGEINRVGKETKYADRK